MIHIHGIRVSRLSPLRGVPAFAQQGYHSLVVSYRGDGEAPPTQRGASTLGITEWPDISLTAATRDSTESIPGASKSAMAVRTDLGGMRPSLASLP